MTAIRRAQATVLLIASDLDARAAWTVGLEAVGHAVIGATTVAAAIAHAREGGIDAVVFDASDRPADGRPLVDALARLPEPPPLILVSSSSRGPELSATLGATAFIPKPCSPDDLASECARLLAWGQDPTR